MLAVRGRERLGLPRPLTTACAFSVVPMLTVGFEQSRGRDAAMWAAHMWAYKNAFELPNDDREPNPTEGDHEIGANPFAAMPSDHFASAAMTAMLLAEQGRVLGAVAWSYALLLAFTLVYLGEHYVTDLLAGLALAVAVNSTRGPLERLAKGVLGLGPESARDNARRFTLSG